MEEQKKSSILTAKFDVTNGTWEVTGDTFISSFVDVSIEFSDSFTGKYGLTFSVDTAKKPVMKMVEYVANGEPIEELNKYERVNVLLPEQSYLVNLWVDLNGVRKELTHTHVSPRPPQPFPSWTWDGSHWVAPIQPPNDDVMHNWDEETQSWYVVENQ